MAEGLARHTAPKGVDVYSAGSKPATVNPLAVRALREIDIDITPHHSKGFDQVPLAEADFIITLCAEEECPFVVSPAQRISWAMADPGGAAGDDEAQLERFRHARDKIAAKLSAFWKQLATRGNVT